MPLGAAFHSLNLANPAGAPSIVEATGGTISGFASGGTAYRIHRFTTTGANTFTVTNGGTIDFALIGGGGGGGGADAANGGGGGGAGAVIQSTGFSVTPQSYSLSVGAGGTFGLFDGRGFAGSSTTGFGSTAGGGGGGGGNGNTTSTGIKNGVNGVDGSSGGGGVGSALGGSNVGTGGTGSSPGTSGADGNSSNPARGGGGGGSGGAASNQNGGAGTNLSSTFGTVAGVSGVFAGGGGGGFFTTQGTGGSGGGGNGGLTGGTATAGTGSGGGGAGRNTGGGSGGAGGSGIILIRYSLGTSVSAVSFNTSVDSTLSTITIPSTIQAGDLAILFDWSTASTTAPTTVTPTNWTSAGNSSVNSTTAGRGQVSYKILTASDANTTVTGMAGNPRKTMLIYRPTGVISTVTSFGLTQQATISAPSNQTLVLGTYNTALDIGFAQYASNAAITTGSTITPTRTLGSTTIHKVSTFEGGGFSNSTISMADFGTNLLRSFILRLG